MNKSCLFGRLPAVEKQQYGFITNSILPFLIPNS